MYLVQVSLLLIGQQGLGHFFTNTASITLSAIQAASHYVTGAAVVI
jgi:hypothetical protein